MPLPPGVIADEPPIAIGPVLSTHADGAPVYAFEVLFPHARVERVIFYKAAEKLDRKAKADAIFARMRLTTEARARRPVVLAHDDASFKALRYICGAAPGPDC